EDCFPVRFELHTCTKEEGVNSIGITGKILISRFDIVKQLLEILQNDEKRTNVVLRRLSKLWVNHVLPTPTFRVTSIDELTTGSAIGTINWHSNLSVSCI